MDFYKENYEILKEEKLHSVYLRKLKKYFFVIKNTITYT